MTNKQTIRSTAFKVGFLHSLKKPLFYILLLSLCCSGALRAQQYAPTQQDTSGKLKVESAEAGEGFFKGNREIRKLSGNVRLRQENTLVYCDTAIIDLDDALLKGNVIIEQGDSVKIFSDSARYYGARRQSELFSRVVLENGRQKLFTSKLHYDLANKIATYHTGATMNNGKSQLSSRHGYYYVDQKEIFFKGKVVITDPEFTVRTDTMAFNTESQIARFVAPTLISQRESKIYCEGGFYDIENKFAEFDVNPQYERKEQKGRAKKMRYLDTSKEYILEGDAYIEEPTKKINADVVRYNTETEQAVLTGNAHYRDSTQDITGEQIRYDGRNKRYQLAGRGKVIDKANIIEADSIDFNDQLGAGLALGKVVWRDTASKMTVFSHRMDYNKRTEYLHAFGAFDEQGAAGRPLLHTLIDKDTLFMSADTLTSFKPDTTSDKRILLAYRDVRIFKNNLQAACDSLSFSSADSIFWFYQIKRQPLIWSDTSQFSADTIRLALKNKKIDRIWLRQNALIVNTEDEQMFNQIKGKNTTAYFSQEQVREMYVDGSARAIYYALDDRRAYIGVNETECSEMRLYFGNNQVQSIKFYNTPKGKFTPMSKAGKETKKLEGFFWEKKRRPLSVADLLKLAQPLPQ